MATIRGTWRDDGTFIGFDYEHQNWYDTQDRASKLCDPYYSPRARLGNASNPITVISARDNIIPD